MVQYPIIRIEIDKMREAIMHQFSQHQDDITSAVEIQLVKAIKEFDFESAIKEESKNCLESIIREYFKYGNGDKMLRELTKDSLDKIFNQKLKGEK